MLQHHCHLCISLTLPPPPQLLSVWNHSRQYMPCEINYLMYIKFVYGKVHDWLYRYSVILKFSFIFLFSIWLWYVKNSNTTYVEFFKRYACLYLGFYNSHGNLWFKFKVSVKIKNVHWSRYNYLDCKTEYIGISVQKLWYKVSFDCFSASNLHEHFGKFYAFVK